MNLVHNDHWLELAEAASDGTATPEQIAQMQRLIVEHDDAARFFAAYLDMHAELLWQNRDRPVPQHSQPVSPVHRLRPVLVAASIVLAIGVVMGVLVTSAWQRHERLTRPVELFATLIDVRGAVFGESDVPTSPGSQLPGGFLRLESGEVDLEFFSGARVTLTGPCSFGINSVKRGFLERGELLAQVPRQARGFTVGAPGLAVVDLGTEFEMSVGPRASQVRVITGEVLVFDGRGGEGRQLYALQAMDIDETGERTVSSFSLPETRRKPSQLVTIVNGGFEFPPATASFTYAASPDAIPGWRALDGWTPGGDGAGVAQRGRGGAAEGAQCGFLQRKAWMEQELTVEPGVAYRLTWSQADRSHVTSEPNELIVELFEGDDRPRQLYRRLVKDKAWHTVSVTFTAQSDVATIRFRTTYPSGTDSMCLLDAVRIEPLDPQQQ